VCMRDHGPLNWAVPAYSDSPPSGRCRHLPTGNGPATRHPERLTSMPSHLRLSLTEHVPDGVGADALLVVLVHGSLDRAGSFARVIRRLDDLHTVTYDRRGYNRSRHVVPVHDTLDGHVDDLLSIIDGRPAVVVGHSFGGDVALGAALRTGRSGHIRAVAAFEPPMPWLGSWATRPGSVGRASQPSLDHDDPGHVAERFFRRMVGDSAWDRLPEATKEARRADGAALAAEIAAIRVTEAPFDVKILTVPAVFGCGSETLPHHRASAEWLVTNVAESEFVEIEGAAHGAHLTHPEGFARFVRIAVGRGSPVPIVRPRPGAR
jgi:pimeloyl-ACP methyl ester carboxylesterase